VASVTVRTFFTFFSKSKNMTFYVFRVVADVFSSTVCRIHVFRTRVQFCSGAVNEPYRTMRIFTCSHKLM